MNTFIADSREGSKITLSKDESWHCARVLRMTEGDVVRVIDGKGSAWKARLVSVHDKECVAEILKEERIVTRKYSLHIAIAPTKNMDRIEWFAEKATELGIDEISFILCRNSERKVIKSDRVGKIVESAVKQSMQAALPLVHEAVSFAAFIAQSKNVSGKKFIAHCAYTDKADLQTRLTAEEKFLILIGPEGDFSTDEIRMAVENGFTPVSLGSTRLRTETAALYATAVLKAHFESH